jgi:hypothetical protein
MFWGRVYNLGVLFDNLEQTIRTLMNVNRGRDFFYGLWLRLLFGDLLGRRKTIFLLEGMFVSTKNTQVNVTYCCWLGEAFELAFKFGEDRP